MNTPSGLIRPARIRPAGLPGLAALLPGAIPILILAPLLSGHLTVKKTALPNRPSGRSGNPVRNPPSVKQSAPVASKALSAAPILRRGLPSMDILGFLSEASHFMPGFDTRPVSQLMRARGIVEQIRSMHSMDPASVRPGPLQDPARMPLEIMGALRRNMQGSIPLSLQRAEQAMQLVQTLRSVGSGFVDSLQGILLGGASKQRDSASGTDRPKPGGAEADRGISNALSQALVSMDEGKREQILHLAQDIIGKMK